LTAGLNIDRSRCAGTISLHQPDYQGNDATHKNDRRNDDGQQPLGTLKCGNVASRGALWIPMNRTSDGSKVSGILRPALGADVPPNRSYITRHGAPRLQHYVPVNGGHIARYLTPDIDRAIDTRNIGRLFTSLHVNVTAKLRPVGTAGGKRSCAGEQDQNRQHEPN